MSSVRVVSAGRHSAAAPCATCGSVGSAWDRLAGRPLCPDCQERLIQGDGEAVVLRPQDRPCAVCNRIGAVHYLTFPRHEQEPIEIDLCSMHLRALIARRLTTRCFQRLRRKLNLLGLAVEQVFLLHESFYDEFGAALRPLGDGE